jgi:hypothetical protein
MVKTQTDNKYNGRAKEFCPWIKAMQPCFVITVNG